MNVQRGQTTEIMVKYVTTFNAVIWKLTYGFRQRIYNPENVLLTAITIACILGVLIF